MRSAQLIIIFALTICRSESASLLNWLWGTTTDDTTVLVADGIPLVSIPYEAMTEDEKFLQEAAKFTEIQVSSPLETCQHKVIMKIRTSCSEMTEEQLAKLSVNLLNCQSAVEGRKMFPCTEEMSLKQCTTDMDADMWNAYHLMSNRARAVCYAARSTQFRALTELTVNKLMQSAHSQIKALDSLKEGQDQLVEQTVDALTSLTKGNKALLEQQEYLRDAQVTAHKLVTTNLRDLNNEKAMIRAGHAQLAAMVENMKEKLEKASEELAKQSEVRSESHKEILEDLVSIQNQARSIWDKIESSTNLLLDQHQEAVDQYDQMLQKLVHINETIQFIWNITNTMRLEIDQKLGWLTDYIGDTGEQLQKIYRTTLHIVYLLVAMVAAAFLQAPIWTRAAIMCIVPMNLLSYLKHGLDASLDFTSITALILLTTTMYFVMNGIQYFFGSKTTKAQLSEPIKAVKQNGIFNGNAQPQASSSLVTPVHQISTYSKLSNAMQNVYNAILRRMNICIEKTLNLVQSLALWSRQTLSAQEHLSCSYMPANKSHDDVIFNYSNMSEDLSPIVTPEKMYENRYMNDDVDSLVDANELRSRLRKLKSSRGPLGSSSRSVSPSYIAPRILCNATTRTGRKCRNQATHGSNFCSRHFAGSSIMGD